MCTVSMLLLHGGAVSQRQEGYVERNQEITVKGVVAAGCERRRAKRQEKQGRAKGQRKFLRIAKCTILNETFKFN